MSNNIDTILKNKINQLGEYLISVCENETKKQDIRDALVDLPTYKILLFISFIDPHKIDAQVNDFIKLFSINDQIEVRNEIKEYINYFLEVKTILNN